jgi:exopolyphosphatase / guanosine-5'-triphosphate,3'-diphosphate pyrophosphatase
MSATDVIVPRWEWRTFGEEVDDIEASLLGVFDRDAQESEERYFLGPGGGNVKVRDDLMDVKVLREVNAEGLERWEPVLKVAFPLSTDAIGVVVEALGLAMPQFERESYPLGDMRALFGGSARELEIGKRRVRGSIGGCMAEVATATAAGETMRTFAIESEDADAIVAALGDLGLAGTANVSYPRALT